MRASRYNILFYMSLIVVPLLMLIVVAGIHYGIIYANTVVPALLSLLLLIYAVISIREVYLHGAYPGSGNALVRGAQLDDHVHPHNNKGTEVRVVLKRFNNDTLKMDSVTYKFFATKLTTVLGALLDIKAYQDNTVSVRCNCRMGICGSCGMVVNGKPVLACETNLLKHAEGGSIEVAPMLGHPLLKDVVTDFDDFFEKHRSVEPTLYRTNIKEKYSARQDIKQSKEEVDKFLPYSYCIMCGLCLDACPVVNSNPNFLGPQALSQVYRYSKDSRDQKGKGRLFDVDTAEGVWGCEFSGSCSKACPKGVDPSSAIQMMKGSLMASLMENDK